MFISTNDRDMDMGIDRAMDMNIYMNMVMDLHTDTDIGMDLELTWMDIQPKTKSVESVKIYKSKVSIRNPFNWAWKIYSEAKMSKLNF